MADDDETAAELQLDRRETTMVHQIGRNKNKEILMMINKEINFISKKKTSYNLISTS